MSDVKVIDLLKYAGENKPVDFAAALDAVLGQKALEALADRKQEIAANLFRDSEQIETEDQEPEENEEQILDDMAIDAEESEDESEESGESDDQS